MTTLANAHSVDPLMMMEEPHDMDMDDMSIQSSDCDEIAELLLNPFDEEDEAINNLMMKRNSATTNSSDAMMTTTDESQFSSLRQVSAGSRSTTTNNLTPDAFVSSSTDNAMTSSAPLELTNRFPVQLYLSCNPDHLNNYQVEIRKMIQLFEATPAYVEGQRVKGRNRAIVLGQVGVQCSHCGHIFPPQNRAKGSTYFPQKLAGIYQACQILSTTHLLDSCPNIPPHQREHLQELQKTSKASRTAGKDYWASTAEALGVYEDEHGLRFAKQIPTYDDLKAKHRARGETKDDNFKYWMECHGIEGKMNFATMTIWNHSQFSCYWNSTQSEIHQKL